MISRFKLKTHATQGVDVESPFTQAIEIATMIGATSFSVDTAAGSATFKVEGDGAASSYTVTIGQVISITNGSVSVIPRDDFYKVFEMDA